MARSKKVSQTQLAHELGISQALVSLVLNGRRQGMSPESYDRIWAHAVKRGYRPKGMELASSPAVQARQVGFILRAPLRLSTPSNYFGHVAQGLHSGLATQGFATVYLGAEDTLDREQLRQHFQAGHLYQGVVLLGEVSRSFLMELREVEPRIVAVSARYAGLCHSVVGNEPQALDALVKHLHGLGHRRIGWLGGNVGLGRHEARMTALKAALKEVDLALDPRYCTSLQQADRAEGAEAAHTMLAHSKRKDFPTAFVSYNSLMAVGAVRAWEREGWKVPDDLSIASADGSPAAVSEKPRITASGASPAKLGEAAGRLILESTGGPDESFTDLMISAQLMIGDTTAPPKV